MGNTLKICTGKQKVSNSSVSQVAKNFTCEICVELTLPWERKFKNNDICNHPFCKECITKYIQVKVEEDNVALVKCPCLKCDFNLDPLSCCSILPVKLFERWCDLLCEDSILGVDHCYCPNRECSALIMNECRGNVKRSVCPKCKHEFCYKCKISWHAGFSCEESGVVRDPNYAAFGALAEKKEWKRCPRCRHCIELRGGCLIVNCRCGTRFCYKCGKKKNLHWCKCNFNVGCYNLFL
ncbi:E3 ubiquitin-protein ligase RSL1-like [Impatiens glandulifera]|uniref:E3 ubiquitin-protein ligase RSL1-like n=1 Tax=Impatiens glandulifera TaxID=253017 RepID=UPI001FB06FBC|nr:E3 ubiquitin-protein ligase RSL1-like [Impatiens glandulifera]